MRLIILTIFLVFPVILLGCGEHLPVTDFDSCVAAGNPVMESYPRKCRDPGVDRTFTEDIGNVGAVCTVHEECQTPMDFLIRSNCPFGSVCIDGECKVVCPLTYHDPDPEISKSHQYSCDADPDCDCSDRGNWSIDCRCIDNVCLSVEAD